MPHQLIYRPGPAATTAGGSVKSATFFCQVPRKQHNLQIRRVLYHPEVNTQCDTAELGQVPSPNERPGCEGHEVPLRDSGQQVRGGPEAGAGVAQCTHLLQTQQQVTHVLRKTLVGSCERVKRAGSVTLRRKPSSLTRGQRMLRFTAH